MRGAPQGCNACGDAGVGVGLGASGDAHRGGGGVLLVVHMEDHEGVDRFGGHRVYLVLLHGRGKHHVQEVLCIGEVSTRVHQWLTYGGLVGHAGKDRHLRDEAGAGQPAMRLIEGVQLAENAAESARDGHHDRHGVGVDGEVGKHCLHLLVHQHALLDLPLEGLVLFLCGLLTHQQQMRHLQSLGMLHQLRHWISPVEADALGPVDEGDG
mmetsp:Transcript_50587/g.120663  ORF Transcript_50587/g.120663 Transcript_50587/m.120663 type:complete len:210 (+) Transcript_50587:628-1257(+)